MDRCKRLCVASLAAAAAQVAANAGEPHAGDQGAREDQAASAILSPFAASPLPSLPAQQPAQAKAVEPVSLDWTLPVATTVVGFVFIGLLIRAAV